MSMHNYTKNKHNKRDKQNQKYYLSENEKKNILHRFPDFELSYEKLIYKKVNADMFVVIPKGKKYLAWFTYFKDKNVCILMELRGRSLYFLSMEIVTSCFHSDLCFGTILYGTMITYENRRFFSTENIYYYKGKDCSKSLFADKLQILKDLFTNNIRQYGFTRNDLVFGLPIMKSTFQEAFDEASMVPFMVYSIQSRLVNRDATFLNYVYEDTVKNITFSVMADVQNDIYKLYYYHNDKLQFYDIAQIQDYKTSVMMNELFRNIKENKNLDYLEESDDEDEFENINEDKFVDLDKRINMVCVFNNTFKKWSPIRTVSQKEKIITFSELQQISNKTSSRSSTYSKTTNSNRKNNNNYYSVKQGNARYRHSNGNYPRARFANSGHASSRTRS